jgi:hypothetical protein
VWSNTTISVRSVLYKVRVPLPTTMLKKPRTSFAPSTLPGAPHTTRLPSDLSAVKANREATTCTTRCLETTFLTLYDSVVRYYRAVGAMVRTAVGFTLSKTLGQAVGRIVGPSAVSPAQFPQNLYILKHTGVAAIDCSS